MFMMLFHLMISRSNKLFLNVGVNIDHHLVAVCSLRDKDYSEVSLQSELIFG